MCGFIAQLVEHRTGIAEVTGSNPVEALIFFRLLLSSCLNWKIHCDDHSTLSSITAVQIYELFHVYLHHYWCLLQRKHEWEKHGTCSTNLPYLDSEHKYFEVSLSLNVKYDIFR